MSVRRVNRTFNGSEVAKILGVSKDTITRYTKIGLIKNSNKTVLRKIVVKRADLIEYMKRVGLNPADLTEMEQVLYADD